MSTTRRPEPTDAELRAAWQHCRLPTWPDTYEETMQDPARSRLVRLTATLPPRALRKPQPQRHHRPAEPARDPQQQLPLRRVQPAMFDRKRAAAGEREDD